MENMLLGQTQAGRGAIARAAAWYL